jgi:hypothetical protein
MDGGSGRPQTRGRRWRPARAVTRTRREAWWV